MELARAPTTKQYPILQWPQLEGHSPPGWNGAENWIATAEWPQHLTPVHPRSQLTKMETGRVLSSFSAWGGDSRSRFISTSRPHQPRTDKTHSLAISTWKLSPWAGICFSWTGCAEPRKEQSEFTFWRESHTKYPLSPPMLLTFEQCKC